ncbi:MAG TPA: SRPBCC family protein [Gammaproteobacteria bacterium]
MSDITDRIEKKVLLRAPRDRVWRAITDAKEFGTWFGVELDAPFVAGRRVPGRIVPTKVDADVAKLQEPHAGVACDFMIERIEPMSLFSFRWHPSAVEPGADYSAEPTTLVVFELEETAEGTLLTITESGFDAIPIERRAEAFKSNEGGWAIQTQLIKKYVERSV